MFMDNNRGWVKCFIYKMEANLHPFNKFIMDWLKKFVIYLIDFKIQKNHLYKFNMQFKDTLKLGNIFLDV